MAAGTKWVEGLAPDRTVEDAARCSLGPRLSSVAQLLPMAAHLAEHDIEHVHRLRVATRRATAALRLYRVCLARRRGRRMKKWLRQIRRAAGDARDLDVLADRLASDYGEPVAPVVELIARDRAAVQPAIVRVAERCRQDDRFVRRTAKLLKSIRVPTAAAVASPPVRFQDWAIKQFAKVADDFIAALPGKTSDAPALHQFRIRAKALRYAIELVGPAFGPELREQLYPLVQELQERLGRVQDHVAAIARCAGWQTDVRNAALRETLDELSAAESRGLADSIHAYHAWWTPNREQQTRRLLNIGHTTRA